MSAPPIALDLARLQELRGWTAEAMERWGVTIRGDRVVFPVRDASGELLSHERYQPDPARRNGDTDKMRADRGATRELFPPPEMIADDELIDGLLWLVEGHADAMRLWSLGIAAVAIPGWATWKDEWAARFARPRLGVVVCGDCDEKGRVVVQRAATALYERSVDVLAIDLDPGRDDGYDLSDFLVDVSTPEEARRALAEIVELTPAYVPEVSLVDDAPRELAGDERSFDDDGNALRLADRFGSDLRCVIGQGWHHWDETRWRRDDDGAVVRAAREIAGSMRQRAREARESRGEDDPLTRRLTSHAKASSSLRGIKAMVDLAQSDTRLVLHPSALDADPYLLNAPNGTIDLRTGELRPHRRDDLLTRRVAAAYDPDATAPVWTRFLERVLPDEAVRDYVQKMAGAAALGHNRDELLHVLHGSGANGKTKFARAITDALGDYAATAGADLLLAGRRPGGGQPELVRLRGARLLLASESDEGSRLNIALVKALTGGDTIAARLLYANEVVEFVPAFSPWLVTNHRPTISEQSEAIWRRVRLMPFDITIPRNERDPALQGKLLTELPGVLAWLVEGARRYLSEGLDLPDAVEDATESYRDDENPVGRFIAERCEVGPYSEQSRVLYAAWKDWCIRNGEEHASNVSFGVKLSELRDEAGHERFPTDRVGKIRVRSGLRLLPGDGDDWGRP